MPVLDRDREPRRRRTALASETSDGRQRRLTRRVGNSMGVQEMIFNVLKVTCVVRSRLPATLLNTAMAYPIPDAFAQNIIADLPHPRPRSSLRFSQQSAGKSFEEEAFIFFSTFRNGDSRHSCDRSHRRRGGGGGGGGGGVAIVSGARIFHLLRQENS